MTSQKGAQLRWGSNETLPTCVIAKHAARGANPASHTAGLARPGPRTERLSANAHCQHNTCALRDTRLASLLWRCDPLWRQCIRSITLKESGFPTIQEISFKVGTLCNNTSWRHRIDRDEKNMNIHEQMYGIWDRDRELEYKFYIQAFSIQVMCMRRTLLIAASLKMALQVWQSGDRRSRL